MESFPSQLLLALRRFVSWIYRRQKTLIQAPAKMRRQLEYLRSILVSMLLWHRRHKDKEPSTCPSRAQIGKPRQETSIQAESKEQALSLALQKRPESLSYTVIENGDTVSLADISASSLYPFSNGNIRNTSRSSLRSSQNLSIHSRSPSRSSLRPESCYSRSTASSIVDIQPQIATTSRGHQQSTELHRYSTSPQQSRVDIAEHDSTPSIRILVTSPNDTSQTSLHELSDSFPLPPPRSHRASQFDSDSHRHSEKSLACSDGPALDPSNSATDSPDHTLSVHSSAGRSNVDLSAYISTSSRSDNFPSLVEREIRPVLPAETLRYSKRTKILKRETDMTFEPITLDFSTPSLPAGWIRYAHPEGARYFYHKEKRVYTDAEIYDPEILGHLEADIEYLAALSSTFENTFPEKAEYVVNAYRSDEGIEAEYYCLDHETRLIFFLKTFHANWLEAWSEVPGVTSPAQLRIELEAQYWFFVQLFPNSIVISNDVICELRDIVLHLIGDSMTSPYSTACFTLEDLYKILTLTSELDKNVGSDSIEGAVCLLARKMYVFTHSRFLNFHGESCARIERDFSVYGETLDRRTWFIETVSVVLFSAPDYHLKNLQKMWVDGMMHKSVWERTMKRMNDEWQEFVFFAILLLNADLGLLSVHTVDVDSGSRRSPAEIFCYLSILANIASIVLGLLLMRQNRIKSRETADDVQRFLNARNHPRLGLESLAILYSLPYALLMWGLVYLLGAVASTCFQESNVVTRSLVSSFGCAILISVIWCIRVFWENKIEVWQPDRPLAYSPYNETTNEFDNSQEHGEKIDENNLSTKPAMLAWLSKMSTMFRRHKTSYDPRKMA